MNKALGIIILLFLGCTPDQKHTSQQEEDKTSIVILGTAQDAGSPQIGCTKDCCKNRTKESGRMVSSIGLIDAATHKTYLFDATPDMPAQVKLLTESEKHSNKQLVDGIFLTHAHIGHYTGLMYLGNEATDAKQIPVYAMPRMQEFLSSNGPWDQLVKRNNVKLHPLQSEQTIRLSEEISITPLLVPHRDEYSETVGYRIQGPNKNALFIPDIDKWDKWEQDIIAEIAKVDYAFLDATFYSGAEMNNRDISEIPHPFAIESISLFDSLPSSEKKKVHFIHFNHTNPLLDPASAESKLVLEKGFNIARLGAVVQL